MIGKRLAIVSTHPIQYHAAWFRRFACQPGLSVEVLYCHQTTGIEQGDAGFGVEFDWDVSLLDGYPHRFLENVSRRPGIASFGGLDTPEIKDIVARERFDAVMVNGWHYKSAWQTLLACWKTGTPVMMRSDSHLRTERSALKRMAKSPFYRWFIAKLDACLPAGLWSREYFLHYGADPDRIFTVPHVVDTDYFRCESQKLGPQRPTLRAGWGLNSEIVFAFAGKFTEKKRPLDFVHAIGLAARAGAPVAGLMVGDGPLRLACEELVRKDNVPVKFTGFLNQSEIAKAYVAADGLILPSHDETWGLVVNEAMACSRACFVSDQVGCGPDLISKGETGAIYPMGDSLKLSELLSTHSANPALLSYMGGRARKKAEENTVGVAVDGVLRALKAVS